MTTRKQTGSRRFPFLAPSALVARETARTFGRDIACAIPDGKSRTVFRVYPDGKLVHLYFLSE